MVIASLLVCSYETLTFADRLNHYCQIRRMRKAPLQYTYKYPGKIKIFDFDNRYYVK